MNKGLQKHCLKLLIFTATSELGYRGNEGNFCSSPLHPDWFWGPPSLLYSG